MEQEVETLTHAPLINLGTPLGKEINPGTNLEINLGTHLEIHLGTLMWDI
jgi:hypothetical protein